MDYGIKWIRDDEISGRAVEHRRLFNNVALRDSFIQSLKTDPKNTSIKTFVEVADVDEVEKIDVEHQNRRALVELMLQYGITIPQRQLDKWRPTERKTGIVDGFDHLGTMECLATDGLQAYYLLPDDVIWLGHVDNFVWSEADVSFVVTIDEITNEETVRKVTKKQGAPNTLFRKEQKPKMAKPRKPRKSTIDQALEFLMKQGK